LKTRLLIIFSLWVCQAISSANHEALLLTCQSFGHSLFNNCVRKIPVSAEELSACMALKASYLGCLNIINDLYPMEISKDPDPYVSSPFTPCTYETGHLVLYDICPSLP